MINGYQGEDTEYFVPEGTCCIEELAFAGSDRLERLYIPDSVKSIGNYAFMNCYSLREIRLPERIEDIGAGLFQNCWQLRRVKLPEGTVTLGTDMFENCHSLAELKLPKTLREAARTSLSGCRNLRSIYADPAQLDLLPPHARYTAALTFMEEHAGALSPGSDEEGLKAIDSYVRERQKSFLDLAVKRKSYEAVKYMTERGLATEDALREYLEKSSDSGRVEITALMLDGLRESGNTAVLSEDPFAD